MSDVVPLLKFTPSAQDPQVLETITVQREPLIKKLVELALDADDSAPHQLLIGPRGIGKTHILSLVASRLRAESDSDSFTLAWLEEDPWSVGSYGKLLAAILAQIAEERSDPELAARADELRASRGESGRDAEEALRDAVGDSRLVLLVENLDEIFRRIGANGQERLRAFVENWKRMLVIATAPQLFEGVQLHESPFYGFFAITHLEELNLDSATELMRRVAELREDEKLVAFLGTDVARRRLEAVEALAGGHPRIWLLLSGCVSVEAIDELVPLFLEALDDLTPYYQDRLRELGDQQQEIVVLLSEAGGALSNRALAERSGIPQNQIATILKQLTERCYVRRAEVPEEIAGGDARMSFWELREPLMRLCLDVKQARGKPLRMVVEFLRAWYGSRLLDELAALPPTAKLATAYVGEAFRTFDDVLPADELFRGSPSEILARAELGLSVAPRRADLQLARASGLAMEGKFEEARDALESLLEVSGPSEFKLAITVQLAAVKAALGESFDADALVASLQELRAERPDDGGAQFLFAMGMMAMGRNEEAAEAFQRAAELDSSDAIVVGSYGDILGTLDRHEEALNAFTRAVDLEPDNAYYQDRLGVTLRNLGRAGEAVAAHERATELDPDNPNLLLNFSGTLLAAGRHEEALSVIDRAIELNPSDGSLYRARGIALGNLERFEAALDACSRAAELEPSSASPQNSMANLLRRLDRLAEARGVAREAIARDGKNPIYRFTLAEITLTGGDIESAVSQLREALEVWSEQRHTPPGETDLLCRILWELPATTERRSAIERIVEAYDEFGAAEELGRGLVGSISLLADPGVGLDAARSWVDDWRAADEVEELQIPMRLLRAAGAWKQDRDRSHLLELPPEQRQIVIDLLPTRGAKDR